MAISADFLVATDRLATLRRPLQCATNMPPLTATGSSLVRSLNW